MYTEGEMLAASGERMGLNLCIQRNPTRLSHSLPTDVCVRTSESHLHKKVPNVLPTPSEILSFNCVCLEGLSERTGIEPAIHRHHHPGASLGGDKTPDRCLRPDSGPAPAMAPPATATARPGRPGLRCASSRQPGTRRTTSCEAARRGLTQPWTGRWPENSATRSELRGAPQAPGTPPFSGGARGSG